MPSGRGESAGSYFPIGLKAKYAFYSALVFFLISNPETYKMTQMLFGRLFTISTGGCPTPAGLFFHSAVFFVVLLGLMLFPRDE
jgi:hypothetical protein